MDAWNLGSGASVLTNASLALSVATTLASDPFVAKVLMSQKQLLLDNSGTIAKALLAACNDDLPGLQSVLSETPDLINDVEATGITPLIYAIFFNHLDVVEFLLSHLADPDCADTAIAHYTPLMWAIHLDQLKTVKVLLRFQADPYLCPDPIKHPKANAVSMVYPENTEMYDYFKSHNLLLRDQRLNDDEEDDNAFYKPFEPQGVEIDDLSNKIRLQSITASHVLPDENDGQERERAKIDLLLEEESLSRDPVLAALPEFDYSKLRPDQYVKFNDTDITSLLDYIFELRMSKSGAIQHETKIPAAILFQLLRFAHLKAQSAELTEFLFDCFIARLRSVTNTKSGVFMGDATNSKENNNKGGDIVLLSYWLSVIQFLHFYFCKSDFYLAYPKFLQELVNTVQSLIATLSFAINLRLNSLIDECLLNYTNLIDVSSALYAKDWNFFKSKKKHPNTYDDIFNMLFPPSDQELMKPSPLRFVQVLGALDYVLKLHNVDALFSLQTFSQVFHCINATIFNRIISQSKYCTRGKAVQIRLNISAIEDWLRGHNYKVERPDLIGGLDRLLPHTHAGTLLNILAELPVDDKGADPHYLGFYYTSLFHIGTKHLLPTVELLQWLQCMSRIVDEEALVSTINQFEALNYFQIVKTMTKLYKYEVDEPRIPKALITYMKRLQSEQGERQVENSLLHYMTQTNFLLKETYVYLNPNFVFAVAMPNLQELINKYGAGLGGVRVFRAKKYQPSLPISIMDDVDEILAQNKADQDNTFNEDNGEDEADDETEPQALDAPPVTSKDKAFKGDQLFKEVQLPSSLMHKNWGDSDIDVNPW